MFSFFSYVSYFAFTRGAASSGEDDLLPIWKECSDDLKDCIGSVVLPVGSLSVGLCRHRAVLFKVWYKRYMKIYDLFVLLNMYHYG